MELKKVSGSLIIEKKIAINFESKNLGFLK